jgi:hypothetical protein
MSTFAGDVLIITRVGSDRPAGRRRHLRTPTPESDYAGGQLKRRSWKRPAQRGDALDRRFADGWSRARRHRGEHVATVSKRRACLRRHQERVAALDAIWQSSLTLDQTVGLLARTLTRPNAEVPVDNPSPRHDGRLEAGADGRTADGRHCGSAQRARRVFNFSYRGRPGTTRPVVANLVSFLASIRQQAARCEAARDFIDTDRTTSRLAEAENRLKETPRTCVTDTSGKALFARMTHSPRR